MSAPELSGAPADSAPAQGFGDRGVGLPSGHANERRDLLDPIDVLEPFHATVDRKTSDRTVTDLLTADQLDVDTFTVREDPCEACMLPTLSAHRDGDGTRRRVARISPAKIFPCQWLCFFPRRILFALRWIRWYSSLVKLPRMRSRSE